MKRQLHITGIPETADEAETSLLRSRLLRDVEKFTSQNRVDEFSISISTNAGFVNKKDSQKFEPEREQEDITDLLRKRALQYSSQQPSYSFDQLIVSCKVKEDLVSTVDSLSVESIVFDGWGLRQIQPSPRTVLNFYGPPGTGKTLAAHAVAAYLKKPILLASYADIESKFHGDGPKNLKSIFYAAERDGALLFIDEADSLLSKRLGNVSSGSEQAINSMRSQLLICLEQFQGIVVFATNLVENYDVAFETRLRHLHFPMPNAEARLAIWRCHLPKQLPLAEDVSLDELAQIDDICGRDIREAVIDASNRAALRAKQQGIHPTGGIVTHQDLADAIFRRKERRIKDFGNTLDEETKKVIKGQIQMTHSNGMTT